MSDQNNPAAGASRMPDGAGRISEEDTHARSTPVRNVIGAVLVGAIGSLAMILSLQMDNPSERFVTAPGLLPFLVGASLLAMAAELGRNGIRHGGLVELREWLRGESRRLALSGESRRALVLMALVGLYVVAVDLAYFDWTVTVAGTRLQWGSFEAISALFLVIVLRVFWRGSWFRAAVIGLVFATVLAGTFRYGFHIPMPGSG